MPRHCALMEGIETALWQLCIHRLIAHSCLCQNNVEPTLLSRGRTNKDPSSSSFWHHSFIKSHSPSQHSGAPQQSRILLFPPSRFYPPVFTDLFSLSKVVLTKLGVVRRDSGGTAEKVVVINMRRRLSLPQPNQGSQLPQFPLDYPISYMLHIQRSIILEWCWFSG